MIETKLNVGTKTVNISFSVKQVPENVQKGLKEWLRLWNATAISALPENEKWWGVRELGIMSPIVRIDMPPSLEFNPRGVYEVEARPAGMGIFCLFSQKEAMSFREIFQQIQQKTGRKIAFLIGSGAIFGGEEDEIFCKSLDLPVLRKTEDCQGYLLWFRGDGNNFEISHQSLTPVNSNENKFYLIKLGLAELVNDPEDLPWDRTFVIKPIQGTWAQGVKIWYPKEKKKGTSGVSTKSQILRYLNESNKPCLWQEFNPGQEEYRGERRGWTINRIFCGYRVEDGEWTVLGGLWNWRSSLLVHGASDSIFGLLST